nr:hypothetical protein [Kibdelosporangium sp. MJ126-NF4]CTQ94816.1 hypothetical protein [Kibdelosporangium sp. MJ126-NF4]
MEVDERSAAIVAAQAPRVFAAVIARPDDGVQVLGWGMEFDDGAYMITADGRNYFALAEAENALRYIRCEPGAITDLVWVGPATPESIHSGQ